jgi:integrase
MDAPRKISGKGWFAFYREDHGQWVAKYRVGPGDWPQHRVPAEYQDEHEVRRHMKGWLPERLLRLGVRTAGSATATAGGLDPNITFQQFGELWTSGDLSLRFPDYVNLKKSADDDVSRLSTWVHPVIGNVRVADFEAPRGLELAEAVMARIPAGKRGRSKATRRHVAQVMHKLLDYAAYPAKLLRAQPLPKSFMPKVGKPKAAPFLYPDEDLTLMRATQKVSLGYRLFWGFDNREGPRTSEVLAFTWEDFDLRHGTVKLDENKTGDPRTWALSPGVLRALRAWKERYRPDAKPTDKVFVEADGSPLDENDHLAAKLREHLRAAGIDRPELFANTEHRRHVCALDARATLITISLTNGKSETWVSDRTGHRSSAMIQRYNRKKRMLKQLLRASDASWCRSTRPSPSCRRTPTSHPSMSRTSKAHSSSLARTTRTTATTQALTTDGRQVRPPWCNHVAICTTSAPRRSRQRAAFPHPLA